MGKKDILIMARPEKVEHKIEVDVDYCWWTVRPRHRPLGKVMFCWRGQVYAEGKILAMSEGEDLHFGPLKRVNYPAPKKAPTRGFTYVDRRK